MNTPTPRTSAAIIASGFQAVPEGFRAFAGNLERELTALTTERDQLRAEVERLNALRSWSHTCIHHNDEQRAACPVCLVTALTAERDQLRAEVKSCGELSCDECNARTAALTAECDQLRAVFPKVCAALANGAFCTPTVSVGFIESIPNEVQLVVAELRARADRAEADLAKERARLDSGQILLTVAGERVWHCGVDLRAAIDAAMREGAK